jgi:CheY-like chemotaxis protein
VVVSNGEEAIRTLARGAFDLVLMDCQMPVMDGFATTEKIRAGVAGKQHQQVPIIAMTANALAGDRERCLKAGMNDYLPKPIVLDELRHKALRWLSVTQQHAAPVASSVDSAELPVFDVSELLRNCGQDRDLALAVIDAALFETTSYLTELGRLLGQADTLAVASQCHVLTGLFAQLSGKRLAAILRRLEAAARLGDMPSLDVMPTLGREYEALQLALHGFRNA